MGYRFSIITITYNAARFLEKTLASLDQQTFKNYEHIIWDGGSTDTTLEIVRQFPHIKIFKGRDRGIADAMNKGAEQAAGQYLLHLHADDLLAHPQVLSQIDTHFDQYPHLRWLYGQASIIDEQDRPIRKTQFSPFSHKRLRKYNLITHPATFIERALFEQAGGFDPACRYCMDYELWLRLAQISIPMALPAEVALFREHQGSLSTARPREVADEAYRVRNQYVRSLYERFRSYRTWKKRLHRLKSR